MTASATLSSRFIAASEALATGEGLHPNVTKDPLSQIFQNEESLQTALQLHRDDLIDNTSRLTAFLKNVLELDTVIDPKAITEAPVRSVIILMLQGNESEDLRVNAAEEFKRQYPENTEFHGEYFLLKDPSIFLDFLFITLGKTTCSNPKNKEFLGDEMFARFSGNFNMNIYDVVTIEESVRLYQTDPSFKDKLVTVEQAEKHFRELDPKDPNYDPDFRKKLVIPPGHSDKTVLTVVKWQCTYRPLNASKRLDDLFISSRRHAEQAIANGVLADVEKTSPILETTLTAEFGLQEGVSYSFVIMGAWGAGKSEWIKNKFPGQTVTPYSIRTLMDLLPVPGWKDGDHVYEAMLMKKEFLPKVGKIRIILVESAGSDPTRLADLIRENTFGRKLIMVHISNSKPEKTIAQYKERETEGGTKLLSEARLEQATTIALNDRKYLPQTIETVTKNGKIHYYHICDGQLITTIKDGVQAPIADEFKELYASLVPQNAPSAEAKV